jgi:hypothetical protein
MMKPLFVRAATAMAVLASLTAFASLYPAASSRAMPESVEPTLEVVGADPLSSTSTFYLLRADLRKCASPMCGGYFVRRVNEARTRCANGKLMLECYVAEIDWKGHSQVEARKALLRGSISSLENKRFRDFGKLIVTEAWEAASDSAPEGTFYRVRDRGLRCITFPCPTHHEAKLNSTYSRDIAGVDLSAAHADDNAISAATTAMTGPNGILVAGSHTRVTGPGGKAEALKASQFFLAADRSEAVKPTRPGAPCRRTGCSSQICSDHTVVSTCEWRDVYVCYQKATCARQADGNCGFTKTRELTECLARY